MNDIRMAINTLKLANELSEIDKSEIDYMDNSHLYKANLTAMSALEKQIPKKPREVVDEKGWEDWACPKCRALIEGGSVMLHCWNCGQKLDWSVEE